MAKTKITYDHNNYGTVHHDGMVIDLDDQAQPTSRLLSDNLRADNYCEWSATGKRSDGADVRVYWLHKDIEGVEPEYYDWDDVHRVELD